MLPAILAGCANDTSLVHIGGPNERPVAVIAGNLDHAPLDTAIFDASSSYDPDGFIAAYEWEVVERPVGSDPSNLPQSLSGGTIAEFFVDLAGDYTIRLTVRDDRGATSSEEFSFSAVPWQAFHVQLTWNKAHADIDLHVVNDTAGGSFYDQPYDCFFDNKAPNWGTFGSALDDPRLDIDDIEGYGPENINITQPDGSTYHIYIHSYNHDGDGSVEARVRIYLDGAVAFEATKILSGTGKVWNVAVVNYQATAITPVGTLFDYAL